MNPGWIAYTLLAGTLVAAAVLSVDAVCRMAAWPRRWAWIGGMFFTLVFAVVAPEKPVTPPQSLDFALTVGEAIPVAQLPAVAPQREGLFERLRNSVSTRVELTLDATQNILPRRLEPWYISAWAAATTTLVILLVLVHLRFMRARKSWPATRLHGVAVRVAPSAGPAVVGAIRPDIVIPSWLLTRSSEEQLMVLEHEGEHVRARDPLLLAIAWASAVFLPWHPAVWWMLSRLRLAVELDCDARVLSRGAARRSYGALLIDLSQQTSGLPVGATALADRTTQLERRLIAMNERRPTFSTLRGALFAVLALVLFISACALRVPARTEPAEAPAVAEEAAASTATPPQMAQITGGTGTPIYFIDGVRVNAEQGRAMPASLIASMEARRPASPGEPAQVHITSVMGASRNAAELRAASATPPAPSTTPVPPVPPARGTAPTALSTSRPPFSVAAPSPPPAGFTTPVIIVDGVVQPPPTPPRPDSARRTPPPPPRRDTLGGIVPLPSVTPTPGAVRRDSLPPVDYTLIGRVPPSAAQAGTLDSNLTIRRGAGSDVVVQIRNPISVTGATRPLIIIDGVIQIQSATDDPLDIAPERIESIEVVRGAAAVALYGQRAANGVINIKTKR